MTKEEFLSKLPGTIYHHGFQESHLTVVDDNPYRKSACYMNEERHKSGYRAANNWDSLCNEMTLFLTSEGHVK
jgi:Sec7-like guanine-nucleotide exchange factor